MASHQPKKKAPEITEDLSEFPRECMLSEPGTGQENRIIEAVADLAPSLKEAQLRVLLALAARAKPPLYAIAASLAEIQKFTGCSRPNIVAALEELSHRKIIATRKGTRTHKSAFLLQFLRSIVLKGGFVAKPPPTEKVVSGQNQGSFTATPPSTEKGSELVSLRHQGGFEAEPGGFGTEPPLIPQGGRPRARVINPDSDLKIDLIDRALTPNPDEFDRVDLETVKRYLKGYQAKFPPASFDGQTPGPCNSEPVPDTIAAGILTMVPMNTFMRLMRALATEHRRPGYKWSWFLTVVAQRCIGVSAEQTAARRKGLKLERPKHPALTGEQQSLTTAEQETEMEMDTAELKEQIAELAERKRMKGASR